MPTRQAVSNKQSWNSQSVLYKICIGISIIGLVLMVCASILGFVKGVSKDIDHTILIGLGMWAFGLVAAGCKAAYDAK